MERLRRALTIRKKKSLDKSLVENNSKPAQWSDDERKVRDGACSFQVKYLGSIEVFESRGMAVCEEAMKQLLKHKSKRKSKRAVLYVSGDALRVTEEISKGLIVDQVIEKVSFCAPTRSHSRGFAYICRDATTRRWLCHGFKAVKESGERLSHAVGCAFAVCLEKKQQREKESVDVTFNESKTSFSRFGSFKQATITERRLDPQSVIIPEPVSNTEKFNDTCKPQRIISSVPRPHASQSAMERQSSLRIFPKLQEQNTPFKRDLSVKISDLSSTKERRKLLVDTNLTAAIDEDPDENKQQLPDNQNVLSETDSNAVIGNGSVMGNKRDNNNDQALMNTDIINSKFGQNPFVSDPFSAAPINPAAHFRQNPVLFESNRTNFSNQHNPCYMSARLDNAHRPGNIPAATMNNSINNNVGNSNWVTGNSQYRSFNNNITSWSDQILKPVMKERESNEKNVLLCANSSQKNPFDVSWVHHETNNNNNIVTINNRNPFKT